MTKEERIDRMRTYVKLHNSSTIQEIADYLGVSHMTVRRDLGTISSSDHMKVIHGGVLYKEDDIETHGSRYDLELAKITMREEKLRIARKAVSLIEQEDIIIIDAGSTGEFIASLLPEDVPLTVICYALNIATIVSTKKNCSLIVTGGYFHQSSKVLESVEGLALFKQNRANKTFITASGVNYELGVTCSNFFERTTKQTALQSASTRILVADSSKFGVVKSGHYADITDFDIIITDSNIKQEEVAPIRKLGNITLYCV
ncbi:DeoR/GlpR transcriptional regulator [Treponema parvum]|uniref:DeoR/GlpR transcriptional regulator n=1 Tax=Treponema parvum TaxID=138851 RepID=A0A975IEW1_9SPIR|nr:DeoR/GlpR family DNA-binding transcription regulator [Treponema parvum]QTQ14247.1 DeoR/GlpR transcriptional regulator [Treponema parvum]